MWWGKIVGLEINSGDWALELGLHIGQILVGG